MKGSNQLSLTPGWIGIRDPRACVIGLGLIGGSWAGALHQLGWRVWAVDACQETIQTAVQLNWIVEGWLELPEQLDVDLVIVALPLGLLGSALEDLAARLPENSIVTDVGSLKTDICAQAIVLKRQGIHFIGGHPMTGSEKSGIAAAFPELFRGYPYVLTPTPDCPDEVLAKMRELVTQLGAKLVLRDPNRHDEEVAMISHIPHALAVALALAVEDTERTGWQALQLAGRSFREITRIVDSSPEMWRYIMVNNAEAILEGLQLWQTRLDELRGYIENGNGDKIAEAFRQAHLFKRNIE